MAETPLEILLVISKMGKGGAQRIVLDLANGLVAQGANVDLLIFFRTPQDAVILAELDQRVRLLNILNIPLASDHENQLERVGLVLLLPLVAFWWEMRGRLSKYHVVHSHLLLASFFAWFAYTFQKLFHRPGPKYVETFHGDLIALPEQEQAFYWPLWRKRDVLVTEIRRKDFQIVQSKLPNVQVRYIPFGIIPLTRPEPERIARYKEQYGIGERPVILSITRLNNQEKRVGDLLDVIAGFRQIYKGEFVYLLVGDGPDRASIQEKTEALGLGDLVRFTGYLDDINALCALADAFLITGIEDLLGIAGLQAASLGVPIVSYQIDPAWKNEDPIFFNSNSKQELAAELNRLLTDEQHHEDSSERSFEAVKSKFSVGRMVSSYLDLYKTLAVARPSPVEEPEKSLPAHLKQ